MSDLSCRHTPPPQGCSGSICEKYGLEACTCASQDGKDETELCHVCCMEKSESFCPVPCNLLFCFCFLIKSSFYFVCLLNCIDCLWFISSVNPNTCSSTGSERLARFFNKKVTTLPAGSPCNDFKGYCDVFMKCRLVDADGPLARLKKAIFNPELYENIAEWIVVWRNCLLLFRWLVRWKEVIMCWLCLICASFSSRPTGGQCYWWASPS